MSPPATNLSACQLHLKRKTENSQIGALFLIYTHEAAIVRYICLRSILTNTIKYTLRRAVSVKQTTTVYFVYVRHVPFFL